MTKDLQEKAIDIKGKQYVQVKDRVLYFNDEYANGCIITQLESEPSSKMVVVKAKVTPDMAKPERYFTGYSQATWGDGMVNTTAALENAETSAVGRALAMMGIGVIDSVASVDEMNKATRVTTTVPGGTVSAPEDPAWITEAPDNLGNCANCGAPNAWSKVKSKAYCSALCWKK